MEIDTEKLFYNAIRDGLMQGVKDRIVNQYSSNPINAMIDECLKKHGPTFQSMINKAISSAVDDPEFNESISASVRSHLAKILIQRFGGELEKQVNVLKSDPITRAKIVMAIDEIVKSKMTS